MPHGNQGGDERVTFITYKRQKAESGCYSPMDLCGRHGDVPKRFLSLSVISHGDEMLGWVTKLRSLHMQGWRGTSSRDFPATLCVWLTGRRDKSWKLGGSFQSTGNCLGLTAPQNQRPYPEYPVQMQKLEPNWMLNPKETKNQRKRVLWVNEPVEHRSQSKSPGDTRFEEQAC